MGRTAEVLSPAHVVDAGGHGVDVVVNPDGGRNATVSHYTNPGVDALPLPGDTAALEDSSGTGCEHATGYADTRNAGRAAPGEHRVYARDASGVVVLELWLKGDGTLVVGNGIGSLVMATDGSVTINGVVIDTLGNVSAPGDVAALALTPATAVHLSTHVHGTPLGPTSSPVPGS